MSDKNETILSVRNLQTHFKTDDGVVKAVDGVSFDVKKGETLGIVGESGSGKSVTNLSVMRLIPSPPGKIAGGEVWFEGEDLLKMPEQKLRQVRGNKISMIFQDPMTSLNPFLKVSTQLIETIQLHQGLDKRSAREQAIDFLNMVGIPGAQKRVDNYPHQFSGGMRQRVMIAMALSCNPKLLIADEPTTALDVTIQAQILEILQRLADDLGTAVILITHDLGVVAGMCDTVNVMYAGKIVEKGSAKELFRDPKHPYTKGLIQSVPRLDQKQQEKLFSIKGQPPNLIGLPDCCPFYPRCPQVMAVCKSKYPSAEEVGAGRSVNCWLYKEKSEEEAVSVSNE
ncbi:MAG: ABC transporter ATP-binding protein [Alkalispirochaetaceae bacterium]